MDPIRVIILFGLLLAGWVIWRRMMRDIRRSKMRARGIPDEWRVILERNVPLYGRLPEGLQRELEGLISVFLAEKRFEGCGGQEITDEVRVTVSGQACMLLLNRATRFYPKLRTIYVYPSSYMARQPDGYHGVDGEARQGESWQNGPVVLAWDSVKGGACNMEDGKNVVFHEFSHQLDQEDGAADGAPILESRSCYASWARVLSAEYKTLRGRVKKNRRSVVRRYGASHPAEFFAVATEAFLEKPRQMKKKHPEMYDELKGYYRVDPLSWK